MSNHRLILAKFIDDRIDQLGGGLHEFTERLSADMGRPAEVYRKFIYAVRCGRKAIPEGKAEAAWEKRLQLTGLIREEFRVMCQAARAYGKMNGREHLARLEKALAASEAEVQRLRARVLFLESKELEP